MDFGISGSDPTTLLEVLEDNWEFKLTSSSPGKFSIKNELINFLICITRNTCSVQISIALVSSVVCF